MASKYAEFPFGKPGDQWSPWSARRRRSPRKFDADVRPRLRELWAAGDWMVKSEIFAYLSSTTFEEGWDLVWETLDLSPSKPEPREEWLAAQGTAVIAAMRYVHRGAVLADDQIARLKVIVRSTGSDSTRWLALYILRDIQFPEYWQLIEELSEDASADMRFGANMELLRAGREVKAALFDDLDKQRYTDSGVAQLWSERTRLNLSDAKEAWLRARCMKLLAKRREWAAEPDSLDAHGLANWIQKGLPAEERDIDLIARGALSGRMNYIRLMAVRDVAWFDNDRARAWLKKMTREPYRGAVKQEARRQLKLLDAVQQDGQRSS